METKVNQLIQIDALQQQLKSLADEEASNIINNLILHIVLLKSTVVRCKKFCKESMSMSELKVYKVRNVFCLL